MKVMCHFDHAEARKVLNTNSTVYSSEALYDHWRQGGWNTTMVIHAGNAPPQLCDKDVYASHGILDQSAHIWTNPMNERLKVEVESGHKEFWGNSQMLSVLPHHKKNYYY